MTEGEAPRVTLGVRVRVGVRVGLRVAVMLGVGVREGLTVPVPLALGVGVPPGAEGVVEGVGELEEEGRLVMEALG